MINVRFEQGASTICDCARNCLEVFGTVDHQQVSSAENHSFHQGLEGMVVGRVVISESEEQLESGYRFDARGWK